MTAAFSTSGPRASVALIIGEQVIYAADEIAQARAGEVCLRLFEEGMRSQGLGVGDFGLFAADLGPGSFTGVRVGIVLAKTLAWANGVSCAGADAFDLVAADRTVAVPSRKGEWFVRLPGQTPERTREMPEEVGVPLASGFARLDLVPVSPYALVPAYLMEPSISKPKTAYGRP